MEVRFEHINKQYGATYAVRDLTLTIQDGALHFLLGPSGCGKTTTLRMLAGLESPTSGKILFNGKDVTKLAASERGIGMVFQNYALWPHMNVRKNIEYGLKLRKLGAEETKRRLEEVLSITQLTRFVERLPGALSGGQQQRVALARALAIRPNVLLLDEPLSNLDAKLRLEMRDNITRIHRQTGITTVYVTHDQKEALSMGTSISVMRAGDLIQTGTARELYHRPINPFIAGFIGETNVIPGTFKGEEGKDAVIDTPMGAIRARHRIGSYKTGEQVALSIRPEAIRVGFPQRPLTETINLLKLPIEHMTYLGESEQFHFKVQGFRLKANVFNVPDHDLKEDTMVDCQVAPEDALVLPHQADMGSGT